MSAVPNAPMSRRERRRLEQAPTGNPTNQTAAPTVIADRYVLAEQHSNSDTAAVYAAYDSRLNRLVAIKTMQPHLAGDSKARAAFFAEARIYAELQHSGVLAIHDVCAETDPGAPWMVLEYIDGITLTDALRARRLDGDLPQAAPYSTERAVTLMESFLDALRHVHDQQVNHRDLSPANIMLTRSGGIRIIDFGLAVNVSNDPGTVRGTAHFMSPEHAMGERADARSDVYALTCVLFAMLTGRPPFLAADSAGVVRAHCDQSPPRLRELVPSAPVWLETLIDCGLSKNPAVRYRDAGHMLDELQIYRMSHPSEVGFLQTAREHICDIVRDADRVLGLSAQPLPAADELPDRFARPVLRDVNAPAVQVSGMTRRQYRKLAESGQLDS